MTAQLNLSTFWIAQHVHAEDRGEQQRRQRQQVGRVECEAYKLDEVAEWKQWTSMLGVRLKGLRFLAFVWQSFSPNLWFPILKTFFYKGIPLAKSRLLFEGIAFVLCLG